MSRFLKDLREMLLISVGVGILGMTFGGSAHLGALIGTAIFPGPGSLIGAFVGSTIGLFIYFKAVDKFVTRFSNYLPSLFADEKPKVKPKEKIEIEMATLSTTKINQDLEVSNHKTITLESKEIPLVTRDSDNAPDMETQNAVIYKKSFK